MSEDKKNLIVVHELETKPSTWVSNHYIHAATSQNTRKAYQSDIRHYEKWGGKLPATPEIIAHYLKFYAPTLNVRTLSRRLTALKNWHLYQGFNDPTHHSAIKKTLAGIYRVHGKPKEKAKPLTPANINQIIISLKSQSDLRSCRDIALILIGFYGAFRRSELVGIEYEHIRWEKAGIEILIPQSKTDPHHEGQFCVIPKSEKITFCPILTLKTWLEAAQIKTGPVFRSINRRGQLAERALSPLTVNLILKQRAKEAGLTEIHDLSSHSLRRGLASSAAKAGSPLHAIMRHGRWKQVNTVIEYIDAKDRFEQNAAADVMKDVSNEDS